jgi:uncharacterized protein YndB with AHSA1/START domain
MKRWQKVALGVVLAPVVLVAGCGIGGLFIDPKVELGIEKTLAAPPSALFPLLQSAEGINDWWSHAQDGGHEMVATKKSGPDEGAGLVVIFEANGSVMETWTVKAAEPSSRIVYDVDFAGMLTVERTLTLTSSGTGTLVTWNETGEMSSPYMRWMKVLMPADGVKQHFHDALSALDKAAATP